MARGNLKARVDDNGQPLTIPPIKRSDCEIELSPAELLDVNYFCFFESDKSKYIAIRLICSLEFSWNNFSSFSYLYASTNAFRVKS